MKYLLRWINFIIILSIGLGFSNCNKDYSLVYTDNFVAKINGLHMNPYQIVCVQNDSVIIASASSSAFTITFSFKPTLADGKYSLFLGSKVECILVVNETDYIYPDSGFLDFSRSDGKLNGSFSFKKEDNTEPFDANGYFNIQIQVIKD